MRERKPTLAALLAVVLAGSGASCGPGSGDPPDDAWTLGSWFIMPSHCEPPGHCRVTTVFFLEVGENGFAVNRVEDPCGIEAREVGLDWEIVGTDTVHLVPSEPDQVFRFNGSVTSETHVEFHRESKCTAADNVSGGIWTKGTVLLFNEGEQCNGYLGFPNSAENLCSE